MQKESVGHNFQLTLLMMKRGGPRMTANPCNIKKMYSFENEASSKEFWFTWKMFDVVYGPGLLL